MTTETYQSIQLSNKGSQVLKLDNDKILELKGINIIARKEDGYINATQLCQAGNKQWNDYFRTKNTKAYLEALKRSTGINAGLLIKTVSGGINEKRGTWIHRKVAIHMAQWISPEFSLQVTNWLEELLLYGNVNLGQEKSPEQLETKYKEQLETLQNQITQKDEQLVQERDEKFKILHQHNSRLQKHRYHKFKKTGPCFYVITQGLQYKDNISRIKIGIAGCTKRKAKNCPHCDEELYQNNDSDSFDKRLQSHRTLWPQLQVKFAVYTEDACLLEKILKRIYKDDINPGGHEIIQDVELEYVIAETKKCLKMFNKEQIEDSYLIEDNIEEYNKITKTTMKEQEIKKQVIDGVQNEITEKTREIEKLKDYMSKIENYKVKELSNILKEFGLVQKGIKKDQQKRIKTYIESKLSSYKSNIGDHNDKEILTNLNKYTYDELKKLATKYNLIQRGTCNDLCERIKAYLEQGTIDSTRRKDVYQYDKTGKLIKRWRTISELSEELNICKNFIAKVRDQKCLANGFIWMSKNTVFTVSELNNISKTVKKVRRNLTPEDHKKIVEKYKFELSKGGRTKTYILGDIRVEFGLSMTQARRIVDKV